MLQILKYPLLLLVACAIAVPARGAEKKDEKKKDDAKPVIAVFTFDKPIAEKPAGEQFPLFAAAEPPSLKGLVERLNKAKDDKNVKAVVLLLDESDVSLAQCEELCRAIDAIKSAGKKVYAHIDAVMTTHSLALAAGASQISATPTAIIMISGFNAEAPYARGLLDAIGVKPDFLTCGKYKSAAEIVMRKGPSSEAAEMHNWLLDGIYGSYQKMVAKGRGVKPERVRQWIDGALYTPEQAVKQGIIDRVQHRQEFEAELRKKYGDDVKFERKYAEKNKAGEIDFSSPVGVFQLWASLLNAGKKKAAGKDVIGIVYVDGAIMPGKPEESPFSQETEAYSTPIRIALDKIAEDEHVKGVVLRVNSPGGSAVASEIILNATTRVKAKKPLVVSMGDVAGSGGYYVSMGADTIFADATTITASIGVVGGKFATTAMWNKVGITWDSNHRGANAGLLSSDAPFSKAEKKKMQDWMNDVYGVFKGHVVSARGSKLKKPIDDMAGGRVYTGQQALELGLVDKIGTLEDAIRDAAERAKIEDYEVRVYPEPKNFVEALVQDLSGGDRDFNHLAISSPGQPSSLLDLALPHLQGLDGPRLAMVKTALRQLDMLRQERVMLVMPPISIREAGKQPGVYHVSHGMREAKAMAKGALRTERRAARARKPILSRLEKARFRQ